MQSETPETSANSSRSPCAHSCGHPMKQQIRTAYGKREALLPDGYPFPHVQGRKPQARLLNRSPCLSFSRSLFLPSPTSAIKQLRFANVLDIPGWRRVGLSCCAPNSSSTQVHRCRCTASSALSRVLQAGQGTTPVRGPMPGRGRDEPVWPACGH